MEVGRSKKEEVRWWIGSVTEALTELDPVWKTKNNNNNNLFFCCFLFVFRATVISGALYFISVNYRL